MKMKDRRKIRLGKKKRERNRKIRDKIEIKPRKGQRNEKRKKKKKEMIEWDGKSVDNMIVKEEEENET